MSVTTRLVTAAFLIGVGAIGCGNKPGPNIAVEFNGAEAFNDGNVYDLAFAIWSIPPESGPPLDQDQDGEPDFFARPKKCENGFLAACGIPISESGTVKFTELPLGYSYRVRALFRDRKATVLYCGEQTFPNDGTPQTITITLGATCSG